MSKMVPVLAWKTEKTKHFSKFFLIIYRYLNTNQSSFFYLKLLKEEETFNGETEAKDRNGVQLSREPSDGSEMQVRLHAGIPSGLIRWGLLYRHLT
jgi:hypothetical protein